MSVTVYSKPSCVQCTATYRALEQYGIPFQVVDLSLDQGAYETILGMGYRQVPVVIAGDEHWAGFRPDKINALAVEVVAA
jgi:glutaredoxin-like protein NrdH